MVVNTSKSIRARPEPKAMPDAQPDPAFSPGPDEVEENDDAYDRDFPELDGIKVNEVSLRYPDPKSTRFELLIAGTIINGGQPFRDFHYGKGELTAAGLVKFLREAAKSR